MQTVTSEAADSAAGANNIKVTRVAEFFDGQAVIIDTGSNRESALIATVGTSGGTAERTATEVVCQKISMRTLDGLLRPRTA